MIDDKKRKFRIILEDCPVIAAVKDETGLKECLYSESQIIFLLFGDICSVGNYEQLHTYRYPSFYFYGIGSTKGTGSGRSL